MSPIDKAFRMSRMSTVTPAYLLRTLAAWGVALLLFFPLGWLLLTAFKTELQAIAVPPELFFAPTLENFHEVQERSDTCITPGTRWSPAWSRLCWAWPLPHPLLMPWPFIKVGTTRTS